MSHYETLKESLRDEMLSSDGHTLLMSSETYKNLMLESEFADKVMDGGAMYPDYRFVWFELPGHGSFVFPIEINESFKLGRIDTRRDDGVKPTIHFP